MCRWRQLRETHEQLASWGRIWRSGEGVAGLTILWEEAGDLLKQIFELIL